MKKKPVVTKLDRSITETILSESAIPEGTYVVACCDVSNGEVGIDLFDSNYPRPLKDHLNRLDKIGWPYSVQFVGKAETSDSAKPAQEKEGGR